MRKIIVSFCFILFLVSCVNKTNEKTVVSFTSDELDIVNLFIKTIDQENKIIIINESIEITHTTQNNNKNRIYKYLGTKNIGNDLLKSFKKNNNKQMILAKDIVFDFNFLWNEPNNINDTTDYYGIITFSKICFNKEQTKAIIYIGIMMEDNGKGSYYIFEKENNEWKIVNIIGGWIT
jgi:hypothetical protein